MKTKPRNAYREKDGSLHNEIDKISGGKLIDRKEEGDRDIVEVVRINVNMAKPLYDELQFLSKANASTMSDFVRNALKLYKYVLIEKQKGKTIYSGQNDVAEKELVVL